LRLSCFTACTSLCFALDAFVDEARDDDEEESEDEESEEDEDDEELEEDEEELDDVEETDPSSSQSSSSAFAFLASISALGGGLAISSFRLPCTTLSVRGDPNPEKLLVASLLPLVVTLRPTAVDLSAW
jgi:vacuolar-type H+-ATPase subunit I/STV1